MVRIISSVPQALQRRWEPSGRRGRADWNHINSVSYNARLDQIVLSVHKFSELWVIDHSTTIDQAAGHTGGNSGKGGDILYRWGNPKAYRAGDNSDQQLFAQHDVSWIAPGLPGAGNMLTFNNGQLRANGDYSTIDEIVVPVDKKGKYTSVKGTAPGPNKPAWTYAAKKKGSFYSANLSGTQRLDNGNTLACSGEKGRFFEVTPAGKIVWEYINPVICYENGPPATPPGMNRSAGGAPVRGHGNSVFNIYRYGSDYPGLKGKDLAPGKPLKEIIAEQPQEQSPGQGPDTPRSRIRSRLR